LKFGFVGITNTTKVNKFITVMNQLIPISGRVLVKNSMITALLKDVLDYVFSIIRNAYS
jgi:hypothetical protein